MFRSIYWADPDFDPHSIDLVTNRYYLCKLLKVVSKERCDPFRVDMELVKNTLVFCRWLEDSEQTEEHVTGFRGYGQEFVKMFTTSKSPGGVEGGTGYHRVIKYRLGNLTILLRYLVDAFLADSQGPTVNSSVSGDIDDLTAAMRAVRLEPNASQSTKKPVATDSKHEVSDIKIVQGGVEIAQNSLLEIKTRAQHKEVVLNEFGPQLFFGQVRHLKVGYHARGSFSRVDSKDVVESGFLADFERDHGDDLKRMIKVIENIKEALINSGKRTAVLLCEEGSMSLHESQSGKRALPADLLAKWE
jgi:hypothetical protein